MFVTTFSDHGLSVREKHNNSDFITCAYAPGRVLEARDWKREKRPKRMNKRIIGEHLMNP